MRLTKRPKQVEVTWEKIERFISTYYCPVCKTTYSGYIQGNVLRFVCKCGQELITYGEQGGKK